MNMDNKSLLSTLCIFFLVIPQLIHGMHDSQNKKSEQKKVLFFQDIVTKRDWFAGLMLHENPELINTFKTIDPHAEPAEIIPSQPWSPLLWAAYYNNVALCKELLRLGASLNEEQLNAVKEKTNFIDPNAQKRHREIIDLLQCYQPSIFPVFSYLKQTMLNSKANDLTHILNITTISCKRPLCDELLLKKNPRWKKMKINCSQEQKNQILHIATDPRFYSELKRRSSQFYSSDKINSLRFTLIALAICIGADENAGNAQEPITVAVINEAHELTKYLIKKGTKKTIATILNFCTDAQVMELLLERGAQPQTDENNNTPFHKAARKKRMDLCKVLIGYYITQQKGLLTLLWIFKQKCFAIYKEKTFLKCYFENYTPLKDLRSLLNLKNDDGLRAYDYWPECDALDPKRCTYAYFSQRKALWET